VWLVLLTEWHNISESLRHDGGTSGRAVRGGTAAEALSIAWSALCRWQLWGEPNTATAPRRRFSDRPPLFSVVVCSV
jgi:hypothetical protein